MTDRFFIRYANDPNDIRWHVTETADHIRRVLGGMGESA